VKGVGIRKPPPFGGLVSPRFQCRCGLQPLVFGLIQWKRTLWLEGFVGEIGILQGFDPVQSSASKRGIRLKVISTSRPLKPRGWIFGGGPLLFHQNPGPFALIGPPPAFVASRGRLVQEYRGSRAEPALVGPFPIGKSKSFLFFFLF